VNDYLPATIAQARDTRDDVAREFGGLDHAALNWKPSPDRWSIGQCLDHLIVSNELYWPAFDAIAEGRKVDSFFERIPLLPRLFGSLVRWAVAPDNRIRSRAPRKLEPTASEVPASIVDDFCVNVDEHLAKMASTSHVDHSKEVVPSPFSRVICYTVKDAVIISVAHLERHRLQAQRVMEHDGFPDHTQDL
jgi:hypothetical protein